MFQEQKIVTPHLSIDCVRTCPYQPALVAMAYYQTNPTTAGAISVTSLQHPDHLNTIKPIECPPLLHLVWGRSLTSATNYILAAATRTNDVLIYIFNC